jgi:hypothetical protein
LSPCLGARPATGRTYLGSHQADGFLSSGCDAFQGNFHQDFEIFAPHGSGMPPAKEPVEDSAAKTTVKTHSAKDFIKIDSAEQVFLRES